MGIGGTPLESEKPGLGLGTRLQIEHYPKLCANLLNSMLLWTGYHTYPGFFISGLLLALESFG